MSFPVFKDLEKSVADIFGDDFDCKYTLKIKTQAPKDTVLTTNITYDPSKDTKLSSKLSAKYAHPTGFTLEKLEMANDGSVTTETSLVNTAPGLKYEFKGNDSESNSKGDLSFIYKHKAATLTGEVDAMSFSSVNGSVAAGYGAFLAGANAAIKIKDSSISSSTFSVGASYEVPKSLFASVLASKNLSEFSGMARYTVNPLMTMATNVKYSTKVAAPTGGLAAIYKCNDTTTMKLKASSEGVANLSVKQIMDKKFTVVGSVALPSSLKSVKFGVNATLG
mmetsp:Transcript_18954/g.18283  ORF Transcript_18954/g.18283 Transcript_18954/m.18283 type:complete len:279 (-) Transcript_18954:196-1032(-)|eukprot:CAMPEP_0119034148 /NCGR_PEP_ID=MMETSP1177-20130426/1173_1 /TAXON_ID=2985 /ORGANISM="Ochromonas sp, Strain CCMP1899" /LENGTH=278 /DNA_ID=CAMNT_0006991395 /DNA_START=38 /DNA_END=874 /DNA_ORIENTATION=-